MPTVEMLYPIGNKWYKWPVTISPYGDDYKLEFRYNEYIKDEIKACEGSRFDFNNKSWYIKNSERNKFTLQYLCGKNPYKKWLDPIQKFDHIRNNVLMTHQHHNIDVICSRRQILIAGEMGVGKTLMAIEAIEISGCESILWSSVKTALSAVELEFLKWEAKIWPQFITYDSLKKLVEYWPKGKKAPQVFVCDECHKLKNPTTLRYKAAKHIIQSMYEEYDDPYIILMSGTPNPKDPSDWWPLIELLRPGYIKEPNQAKFKKRLALIKDKESLAGGWYAELVTYWDDENKCKHCGKYKDDLAHDYDTAMAMGYDYHMYEKSVNEVAKVYDRLKGIVEITRKKDVLSYLPDKIYKIIKCDPPQDMLRAARLILDTVTNAAVARMLLRELSDGFQYKDLEIGKQQCDTCSGSGSIISNTTFQPEECIDCGGVIQDYKCISCGMDYSPDEQEQGEIDCPKCNGSGEIPKVSTKNPIYVPTPKEDALKEIVEDYEDVGRIGIYAAFKGSVDKCRDIVTNMGWEYIRVDGRGWDTSLKGSESASATKMLQIFQDKKRKIPKLAFVAQPDSGGIGITLTESPICIFYSNSDNGASRQQTEDRFHRPGMDLNKGCTIADIINLPSDMKVLELLKKKKTLQDMTLGELKEAFK